MSQGVWHLPGAPSSPFWEKRLWSQSPWGAHARALGMPTSPARALPSALPHPLSTPTPHNRQYKKSNQLPASSQNRSLHDSKRSVESPELVITHTSSISVLRLEALLHWLGSTSTLDCFGEKQTNVSIRNSFQTWVGSAESGEAATRHTTYSPYFWSTSSSPSQLQGRTRLASSRIAPSCGGYFITIQRRCPDLRTWGLGKCSFGREG